MTVAPCPVCGSTTTPKYDKGTSWCVSCVEDELGLQKHEDTDVIRPQVFDR